MPDKFNELLLKQDIIELYNAGITPDYGYLMNGRFEKDMVKTLYSLKTLSGNPITWEASDTEYLFPVISLELKQAGSGDPSPENVRPISGYDDVTVTQSKDEAQVKQITLTLPETIYGGTVDAVTGVGSKEYLLLELTGKETWQDYEYSSKPSFYAPYLLNTNYARTDGICDRGIIKTNSTDVDGAYIWLGVNNASIYFIDAKREYGVNSVEEWKSYLAAQYAAETPVTVCYKLATPEPFQATGNQALTSFLGYNTIYTNGDSITLNRKARRLEV